MTNESDPTAETPPPSPTNTAWHTLSVEDVTQRVEVDPHTGLNAQEANRRSQKHAPNTIPELADRLGAEATSLRVSLNTRFWSDEEGLYFDRPGGPEVSQYGNAWAVVCGAAEGEQRRRLMSRFPMDPKLAPGSFFCWHAVFRALGLCRAADVFTDYLEPWHEQVERGLDTFVEENSYWRSLCHAWSAHPALEFMTRILGVTPLAPGFANIEIKPHLCGLTHASGCVCTPAGHVDVAWRVEERRFLLTASTPAGASACITLPDGTSHRIPDVKI
jgi:hypothetical protein